jgi:hypothetical protein
VVPRPPEVTRVNCVPITDVCWREGEEIKTAPRYSIWAIPEDIARRASAAGWLLYADSPAVAQMRAAEIYNIGERWAAPHPGDCTNLSLDPLPLAPGRQAPETSGSPENHLPADAVERTGPAIVGTATAVAP